jgi:hypothetical protein
MRVPQGFQRYPEPQTPDSGISQAVSLPGKTQPDLNSSTSSSLEAGLGLPPCFHSNREQRASCSSVGIPQTPVPAGPHVPREALGWDSLSLSPYSHMPLHRMHLQGCECTLHQKYTDTLTHANTCTGDPDLGSPIHRWDQMIILQDVTHSHNHPVHPSAEKGWGRRRFHLQHPLPHS